MISGEYLGIVGMVVLIGTTLLSLMLISKMQRVKSLQLEADKLKRSLDEMDEQAKLIVRTDLELNKAQEELDKKVTGLYSLQRFSRSVNTTLEENQIFNMIEDAYIEDLGFEKAAGFLWKETEKKFVPHINIGYMHEETFEIKSLVNEEKDTYLDLINSQKTISSTSLVLQDEILRDRINRIFKVNSFVISPILPKEGDKGFLFVGTENLDALITEGDEELITVLSNQLGQALENARLFEKTWQAHQELEKRVEERTHELTLAFEEVKKVSRRKTEFVSSVSHELRTPLTSIKGYASILLTQKLGLIPEEAMKRIEKINKHSDELAQLVNDLLDISRLESGRITMRMEILDLNKIVNETVELLSVQLKDRQIELSSEVAKEASTVFADASQIKRVFINIIGNALKFTPAQGKITIRSHKTEEGAQIDISDTGCGIPDESKESIFEEFYRVENTINQEVKGTGLGLALVKKIVEAHKGRIWVTSKLGAGSTFSFILPQQG